MYDNFNILYIINFNLLKKFIDTVNKTIYFKLYRKKAF